MKRLQINNQTHISHGQVVEGAVENEYEYDDKPEICIMNEQEVIP
jgi:hypothetical protein